MDLDFSDCLLFMMMFFVDNAKLYCILVKFFSLVYIDLYMCYGRFSAEGTPYTVDSAGIVRMLRSGFHNTWVEVANLRQHVSCSVFL